MRAKTRDDVSKLIGDLVVRYRALYEENLELSDVQIEVKKLLSERRIELIRGTFSDENVWTLILVNRELEKLVNVPLIPSEPVQQRTTKKSKK